jgi:hypothetical protein
MTPRLPKPRETPNRAPALTPTGRQPRPRRGASEMLR